MKSDLTPTQKIDILKKMALFWNSQLSGSEFKVLLWLTANTIGRGNDGGNYSLKQIEHGIPKKREPGKWCEGVGLRRNTIRAALKGLREKGFIASERDDWSTFYIVRMVDDDEDPS